MAASSDKVTDTSCNLVCNSYASPKRNKCSSRGYSIEAKAYHVIDASEVELTPAEIARKIHDDGSENWNPKMIKPGQYTSVRVFAQDCCRKVL